MRVNAYILVADPAWIEASVLSYYDRVETIIVSFDANRRGWTGVPITVDECLERLQAIDRAGKLRLSPGHYARLEHAPMENETYQRQCALKEASEGADWVLQFDTDEVMADPDTFFDCLRQADVEGFAGMHYPARWLYRDLGQGRYLEACSRWWQSMAGYPGPAAVKAHTCLRHARQCDVPLFRVDFGPRNTDPWRPSDTPVHRVVTPEQAIMHYAWIRDDAQFRRKTAAFGHARDRDWNREMDKWAWSGRHPYLAMALSPFRKRAHQNQLRITAIPAPAHAFGMNGAQQTMQTP